MVYWEKFRDGFIAGAAQTTLLYPLDILHVKWFLHRPIDRYLFNGLGFTLFGNCLKRSIIFPLQDSITTYLASRNLKEYQGPACAVAGALSGLALTPINSIRTPLQLSTEKKWLTVSKEIYNNHGLTGFYRGGGGIMCRNAIWTMCYFPLFESLRENEYTTPISSIGASLVATTASYPFDGSRLYRQHHLHKHNFFYGLKRAFHPNWNNFQAFLVGNLRVSLSICLAHYIYLHLGGATRSP